MSLGELQPFASSDFSQLIADIEQEARDAGPQAVRELEQFREGFSLASSANQLQARRAASDE